MAKNWIWAVVAVFGAGFDAKADCTTANRGAYTCESRTGITYYRVDLPDFDPVMTYADISPLEDAVVRLERASQGIQDFLVEELEDDIETVNASADEAKKAIAAARAKESRDKQLNAKRAEAVVAGREAYFDLLDEYGKVLTDVADLKEELDDAITVLDKLVKNPASVDELQLSDKTAARAELRGARALMQSIEHGRFEFTSDKLVVKIDDDLRSAWDVERAAILKAKKSAESAQ